MNNIDELAKQIIYEDNHFLIINKLPGQLVQGDKTETHSLLDMYKEYIRVIRLKPGNVFLGLTHRLDRPCSGVVVYAKTSKGLSRFNELLRQKKIVKQYLAFVEHKPPKTEATLVHYLKKNEKLNKSFVVDQNNSAARQAILHYKYLFSTTKYHLLLIHLITGRHHQIRTQLSAIGCPIKGDVKYGARRANPDQSIHLHAWSLQFIHPVRHQNLLIIAEPPADSLWHLVKENILIQLPQQFIVTQHSTGIVCALPDDQIPFNIIR